MTVGELLNRTTSRELTEWIEFYKLEPFWPERIELLLAHIAVRVHNGWFSEKMELKDFLPWLKEQEQTTEQQVEVAKTLALMFGKKLDGND